MPPKKKKKQTFDMDTVKTAVRKPADDSYYSSPKSPEIAPATVGAVQTGADPSVLNRAKQYLGNKDYIGLCEAFVEKVTGAPRKFASAYDDWKASAAQAVGLDQAKPGDRVFFAPDKSNGGFGHVGLIDDKGNLLSSTNNGVTSVPLDKWVKSTGQKILGVIPSQPT